MEILSEVTSGYGMLAVIIPISIIFLVVFGLGYNEERLSFVLVGLAGILIMAFWHSNIVSEAQTPKYQVLIHDMSEFDTEKYTIIEQNGKIFTVKENQ